MLLLHRQFFGAQCGHTLTVACGDHDHTWLPVLPGVELPRLRFLVKGTASSFNSHVLLVLWNSFCCPCPQLNLQIFNRLHMCTSCSVLRDWSLCLRCLHFSHLQCRLWLVQTKNSRVTSELGLIGDKSPNSVPASLPTDVHTQAFLSLSP